MTKTTLIIFIFCIGVPIIIVSVILILKGIKEINPSLPLLAVIISFCFLVFFLYSTSCFGQSFFGNSGSIADVQQKLEYNAFKEYPVPLTGNFLERKLIYDWTKRWNVPDTVCYVYIFIGSNCIGYFITHGKPASTQSYLLPEYLSGSTSNNRETPDVDGTYGTNNPGYRFFLANGTAVECSGTMVSCVYSDAPLSLSAVEIKSVKTK